MRLSTSSSSVWLMLLSTATTANGQYLVETTPRPGIDFEGCFSDLVTADGNGDGYVRQNEYLYFIQTYGKRVCWEQDKLTLEQSAAFNTIACWCSSTENAAADCCIGNNARIAHAGAMNPATRTETQLEYMTAACTLTDSTIDHLCEPTYANITTAPPVVAVPVTPDDDDDGFPAWLLWLLLALALLLLLLLCCCLCCVLRRKRLKELEEEEREVTETTNRPGATKGPRNALPEQSPALHPNSAGPMAGPASNLPAEAAAAAANRPANSRSVPPGSDEDGTAKNGGGDNNSPVAYGKPGNTDNDRGMGAGDGNGGDDNGKGPRGYDGEGDDDDEEAGRRRRGGGNVPGDDDAGRRRIRGAGELPPDPEPKPQGLNLRPVPPKDPEENPDWDYPGRDINFPKDQDEMSAGHVDHYEPDGGVNWPQRPPRDPSDPLNLKWQRQKPEDPDEVDTRKHRIQSGLGEGEVWDKLDDETSDHVSKAPQGDVFDWVVQSALGVLDTADEDSRMEFGEDQETGAAGRS